MRKILAVCAALVVALGAVNILSGSRPVPDAANAAEDTAAGSVYYLNFKPEQSEAWQQVAQQYTQLTGVPVTVVTAASGTYEDALRSELAKNDPPTLFQVNGPVGLANWRDYCLDLRDTKLFQSLQSDEFALYDGESVPAVAYAIETYGLIYNKRLLEKYCAKGFARLGGRLGMDEQSVVGIITTAVNAIPMFGMVKDMNDRGIVVNMAWLVPASFILGDHLAFQAAVDSSTALPFIVGKLAGGIAAVVIAMAMTKNKHSA